MAWLTGCLGCEAVIGSPALVALATSGEVGMAWAIFMSRVVSTFSGDRPTLSSARLSTRCRRGLGKFSRSRVSQAILTFFSVGTSRVVIEQQLVGLVEGLEHVLVEGR